MMQKKIIDKKSGLGKPILITWIFFFTDFNKYFLTNLKSIEVYPYELWLDHLPLEEWSGSFSGPGCVSQTGCRRGRFLPHTWHLLTKHKTLSKTGVIWYSAAGIQQRHLKQTHVWNKIILKKNISIQMFEYFNRLINIHW